MSSQFFNEPPYPMDAFLVVVREAGFEIKRNVQAPDALIGLALINAMAMACQALIKVKLPMGQVRPVTQYVMTIAESGERKSTVDEVLLAPYREHDRDVMLAHADEMEKYRIERDWWSAKHSCLIRASVKIGLDAEEVEALKAEMIEHAKLKPKKPRMRLLIRQDITPRAIMDALAGNGESIAIVTDEGQTLFKSGAMASLGLLNSLWGAPEVLSLNRSKEDHVLVREPRASISIMTQPDVLREYIDKRGSVAKGSGHWARYLVAWPQSNVGYRPVGDDEAVWECLPVFHARIKALLSLQTEMYASGELDRDPIEFSDDAKARWFAQANKTEWMLRPGDYLHDITDFGSKAMEIVARLAAVMHYFAGEEGKISLDTLERAIAIVAYHVDQYKDLFSPRLAPPQDQVDAQKVELYLRNLWGGYGSNSFIAKNHLLRNGPVRDRERLNAALRVSARKGAVSLPYAAKGERRYVVLHDDYFGS